MKTQRFKFFHSKLFFGLLILASCFSLTLMSYSETVVSVEPNPLSGANSIQWLLDNYTGVIGINCVIRGGSWVDSADPLRVAYRGGMTPNRMESWCGFRCVKSVTP